MNSEGAHNADYVCLGCGSDVNRGDEDEHCGNLQAPPPDVPLPTRPNPALPSERERFFGGHGIFEDGGDLPEILSHTLDRLESALDLLQRAREYVPSNTWLADQIDARIDGTECP